MKTFVMLAVGLATLRLMRRRSASARHWALAVAIACAASVPLLQPLATSWRWELPAVQRTEVRAIGVDPAEHTDDRSPMQPSPSAMSPGSSTALVPFTPQLWWWLGSLQLTGAAIFVLVLIAGLLRLEWLAARAVPVTSARVTSASRSLERALGITRPVRLLQTTRVALPMTWGALHPIVLLPSGADGWSDVRLKTVLGHELAHVQRGDWLALMLAELMRGDRLAEPAGVACSPPSALRKRAGLRRPRARHGRIAARVRRRPRSHSSAPPESTTLARSQPHRPWHDRTALKGELK